MGGRGTSYPQRLPDLPGEEWRLAVGFPSYSVSSAGRVRRDEGEYAGGILIQSPSTTAKWNKWPYATVRLLCPDGKRRHIRVHRLVMATFVGPLPDGMEVHHRDTNHWNNELGNLEYVTKKQNEAYAQPLRRRGSQHYAAKITEDIARQIRHLPFGTFGIAKRFGVSQQIVTAIRSGKTWRHVA